MLESYLRKLSLIYVSRNGRIAAVLGALVVLLGSVFPVIFPIVLAAIIVMNMLPARDENAIARIEFLERVDDLGQMGGGFLYWVPIISLAIYAAMVVIIEGGLHASVSVPSIGPFSQQITSFCMLTNLGAENGMCRVNGYTVVSLIHVYLLEWVVVGSFIYMTLAGYFHYMASKISGGVVYGIFWFFVVGGFCAGFGYASVSAGQTLYRMLVFPESSYDITQYMYEYHYVNSVIFWSILLSVFVYGGVFLTNLFFSFLSKLGLSVLRRGEVG